ncbi:hypothetical protein FRC17_001609 [Serendipita sp. 399]|nr:hypothetical protein FRC17_001609 [Serendipita sp. 399]
MWKNATSKLKSKNSPVLLTRHLKIFSHAMSLQHQSLFVKTVLRLTELREITFHGLYWTDGLHSHLPKELEAVFANLTHLTLNRAYMGSPQELEQALSAFRSCRSLALFDIDWGYPQKTISPKAFSKCLQDLSLSNMNPYPVIGSLVKGQAPFRLTRLTLQSPVLHYVDELVTVDVLLRPLQMTLSHLELGVSPDVMNKARK